MDARERIDPRPRRRAGTAASVRAAHRRRRPHRQRARVVRLRGLRLLRDRHRRAVLPRTRARRRASCSPSPCSRIGFAARPIGSIVLGLVGDRIGRRALLTLSIALMGGATLGIGLLPTFAQIGVAAPLLLVLLRLVQGFSLGGEFTGSMVYTTELASPLVRGLVSSSTAAGTTLGFILGSLAAWMVNVALGAGGGVGVGLAHPVRRERAASASRAGCCAAGSPSPRSPRRRRTSACRCCSRCSRTRADRADVRHRRDDERRLLPGVHVRRRLAQGGVGSERTEFLAANTLVADHRAAVEAVRRLAVRSRRPAPADDRRSRSSTMALVYSALWLMLYGSPATFMLGQVLLGDPARDGARPAGRDGRRDLPAALARDVDEPRLQHHARARRRQRAAGVDVADRRHRVADGARLVHHALRRARSRSSWRRWRRRTGARSTREARRRAASLTTTARDRESGEDL